MSSVGKHGMKTKLVAIIVVSAALLAMAIILLRSEQADNIPITLAPPDLSDHPIYSNYVFGETDNIIDVGIQPLEGVHVIVVGKIMQPSSCHSRICSTHHSSREYEAEEWRRLPQLTISCQLA